MYKKLSLFGASALSMVLMAANSAMALDWTGITLDTTDVDSCMALIIVGLATLWGYRKVVKTMNRS
jgi:hypothetical protein